MSLDLVGEFVVRDLRGLLFADEGSLSTAAGYGSELGVALRGAEASREIVRCVVHGIGWNCRVSECSAGTARIPWPPFRKVVVVAADLEVVGMAEFEMEEPFNIDNGELDGISQGGWAEMNSIKDKVVNVSVGESGTQVVIRLYETGNEEKRVVEGHSQWPRWSAVANQVSRELGIKGTFVSADIQQSSWSMDVQLSWQA